MKTCLLSYNTIDSQVMIHVRYKLEQDTMTEAAYTYIDEENKA